MHIATTRISLVMTLAVFLTSCQISGKSSDLGQHKATVAEGISLIRSGHYTEAYRLFASQSPYVTKNADILNGLAISADLTNRKVAAKKAYKALAQVASDKSYFYNNRGYSRMLNGELQAAYGDLIRATTLDPRNVKIRNNLRMLRAVLPRNGD